MKLCIETPTKAYLEEFTQDEMDKLTTHLTYTHTGNAHLLKRHYDNHWFRSKNPEKWDVILQDLKSKQKFTLIFRDEQGTYIRPGSIPYLVGFNLSVANKVNYPTPKPISWAEPLPFQLYPYQELGWQKLLAEKHGNVSFATGTGKTGCILKLCQELGLKTAIITPSKSIFLEVLKLFEFHFGKSKVGTFGNGKKKIDKLFTICINDSLTNIKPGTPEWEFFSTQDAIIVDESHTLGSETLEEFCHGIFANVPYRWAFSATQSRGDGTLKLLQSIIGKTVHSIDTKEAVQSGYICDHEFRIIELESSNPNLDPKDPLECKRVHFLRNKNIAAFIAKFCNTVCASSGHQVLVLVDELDQISYLSKLLTIPFVYAHSESKKERLAELGLEKVNPEESVEKFNKNEAKVLIGTSCIATGTNIFPVHFCFNWQGGNSEVKTKQGAVGRSIRKLSSSPWAANCIPKPKAVIMDFKVKDVFLMKKQLDQRLEYYYESGVPVKFVKI